MALPRAQAWAWRTHHPPIEGLVLAQMQKGDRNGAPISGGHLMSAPICRSNRRAYRLYHNCIRNRNAGAVNAFDEEDAEETRA